MFDRIEKLTVFLAQSPDDCFLNHALALEYVKLGDDTRAKSFFEKNLCHDPNYIATYYHLGKLLERNQDEKEAMRMYELGMIAAKNAGDLHAHSELRSAYDEIAY
jgi:tetratricopeptide (TPR) repeat protein